MQNNRVLIVEDEFVQSMVFAMAAQQAGLQPVMAADYREAADHVRLSVMPGGSPFAAILSDGQYPGDGVRFKGTSLESFGSAALLDDLAQLQARGVTTPPVVVHSGGGGYQTLQQHPYPVTVQQPVAILDKDTHRDPIALMQKFKKLAGLTP